jgi:hypothetical protein
MPGYIYPIDPPAYDAADAVAQELFDLQVSLGEAEEEVLVVGSDGGFTIVSCAIGSRGSILEEALIADELHHGRDIVLIEGFGEGHDDTGSGFYLFHADRGHKGEKFLSQEADQGSIGSITFACHLIIFSLVRIYLIDN